MTTTDTKSDSARSLYTQQRMLFMTLDPVHIGAGGYRLGRVDMTIAREPGTSLPKIPGTSLAGAARSYAAMRYGKPDVAGQHKNYAGSRITCPIIYTFGTATDTSPSGSVNQAGTVSIGDAHILFFPVHSMAGPVWVSTVDKVRDVWGQNSVTLPQEPTDDTVVTSMNWDKELNLGWLLFTATKGLTITPPKSTDEWSAIADRIVVVEDDYRTNGNGASAFPQTGKQCKIEQNEKGEKLYKDNEGPSLGERWNQPLDVVKAGMKLIQYLGVGGMGTRGFGRMRLVTDWKVKANDEES